MQRNTGYFPTESLEPCGNRLFSRSALNEGYLFRGSLAGSNQSAINRYETDRSAVPYRMLIWYAQYFDVSMDYIFGLCDDKRGRIVTVSPEGAEEYVRRKPDWSEFVEVCFEPGSELNRKLKQMVLNMAEEHSHGVKGG